MRKVIVGVAVLLTGLWMWVIGVGTGRAEEAAGKPVVATVRVPGGGIQPQAVMDAQGTLHLIYYKGDPNAGDVFYVKSTDGGTTFSKPIRVNSREASAMAIGNIRGAQLALGKDGRVHVAWNGSGKALPKAPGDSAPMLYARMNDKGDGFEEQRNLIMFATGLDGGGSVAADEKGNVYVAWHASAGAKDSAGRRVFVARSTDEGKTFDKEVAAVSDAQNPKGACECCGMRAWVQNGVLYLAYRAAVKNIDRDMYMLWSRNGGKTFQGGLIDRWQAQVCPMSMTSLAEGPRGVWVAWETRGKVFFRSQESIDSFRNGAPMNPVPATGGGSGQRFPVLAINAKGQKLLAWTEGVSWGRGGSVHWQVYDENNKPIEGQSGQADGVPVDSLVAAVAKPDGTFLVIY